MGDSAGSGGVLGGNSVHEGSVGELKWGGDEGAANVLEGLLNLGMEIFFE